jgi:hypothetical protein
MKMCTAEFRLRTLRLPGSASNKANVDRFAANVLPVIERLRRAVSCDYVLPDHVGLPRCCGLEPSHEQNRPRVIF